MSEQEENELICERLLGWKRKNVNWSQSFSWVWDINGHTRKATPTFTTWSEAGLVLDWLMSVVGPGLESVRHDLSWKIQWRQLTPLAIRAAALEYIKAMQR